MNVTGEHRDSTVACFNMTWKYLQSSMKSLLQHGKFSQAQKIEEVMIRLQKDKEEYERITG